MTQILKVDARIQSQPVLRSMPCWVEVTLINPLAEPVMINGRLAMGYKERPNRELFAEVFGRGGDAIVSKEARLYQRDLPSDADYISLQPGESVSTKFDLFKWYTLASIGDYDLVVSYSPDTPARHQPSTLLTGIFSSDRIPFSVII